MRRRLARLAIYEAAFERLRVAGRVYPAYETAQELDLKRKIQLGRGLPPVYDRAALDLTDRQRAEKEAAGVAPHWRFRLDHTAPIAWDDGVRGKQKFDPAQLSDPVVRRADGSWLYMLPSAVDDIEMGVTHVLRGQEHLNNGAPANDLRQLYQAVNAATRAELRRNEMKVRRQWAGFLNHMRTGKSLPGRPEVPFNINAISAGITAVFAVLAFYYVFLS